MGARQEERMARALVSLEGLSVGDGFGERFFVHPDIARMLIDERALPGSPWRFTDDTQMTLSIVQVLNGLGVIDQAQLARSFARHYDGSRGYGPAMHQLLRHNRCGGDWAEAAGSLFAGQGSYGNGAAMRVAPLGAYFADDLDVAVTEARKSASVTHTHAEAVAGAIAVAVAAAYACRLRESGTHSEVARFLDFVLPHVPESQVRSRIIRARELRDEIAVEHAAATLGNGEQISAQDTVPFTLWCAAHYLENFEEALWATVRGLGDRDTTCAIVGGIVACYTGIEGIPREWIAAREPLPEWHLLPEGVDVGI
ncbi:MAG TPA: ADP-ribosylglycohydrolase family protein [Ktedonobacterales bacterium]